MYEVVVWPDTSLKLKLGDLEWRNDLQTEIEVNLSYLQAFYAVFDHQCLKVIKAQMTDS